MRRFLRAIRQLLSELRRRNVYRVGLTYLAAGFVVVELADIAAGTFDLPGWFGPMVWVMVGLGFPIALVIAWAFEVTPEGVRVEEPESSVEVAHQPTGSSPSNGVIAGLLIIAIGLLLYPRVFSSGQETAGQASSTTPDTAQIDEHSIAVLPFEPLSGGEESKTFAQGIHDDLLTRLANISALKVISRTAVQQYRDTDLTTEEIADSLGVRWVMEGGVQVLQNQIQVNAQLIDPRSETHTWADDYLRDLTAEDLFAIQGEITREIADALKAKLTAGEQSRITGAPTENLRAYRLYVKGRSELDSRSEEGMRRAVSYFQQALQEDSSFALAWSGLADARGLYPNYGPDSLDASVPTQKKAARRALRLDPQLAETHASMGHLYFDKQNAPAALRHLKRSVELKPSYAQAQHWLGLLQLVIGRPEEGLRRARRAVELNPQHLAANAVLAWAHVANSQIEEALSQARKTRRMALEAGRGTGYGALSEITALRRMGRFGEAKDLARRALSKADSAKRGPTGRSVELALTEAEEGDPSGVRRLLASDRDLTPFLRGLLHAALGESDAAFKAFRPVDDWRVGLIVALRYMYTDVLNSLHEDPRYEELIGEINQQWGMNPDGSVPDSTSASLTPQADA